MHDELNARVAARFLGISTATIFRYYHRGFLVGRRIGPSDKKRIRFSVDDLRHFAQQYGYTCNDDVLLAQRLDGQP